MPGRQWRVLAAVSLQAVIESHRKVSIAELEKAILGNGLRWHRRVCKCLHHGGGEGGGEGVTYGNLNVLCACVQGYAPGRLRSSKGLLGP